MQSCFYVNSVFITPQNEGFSKPSVSGDLISICSIFITPQNEGCSKPSVSGDDLISIWPNSVRNTDKVEVETGNLPASALLGIMHDTRCQHVVEARSDYPACRQDKG